MLVMFLISEWTNIYNTIRHIKPGKNAWFYAVIFFIYQMTKFTFQHTKVYQMLKQNTENNTTKLMIVSRAKDGMWENYYGKDPKTEAMPIQSSAYFTLAGSTAKIKLQYETMDEAKIDLSRISKINPTGGYGICVIDFNSHDKPFLHYQNKMLEAA